MIKFNFAPCRRTIIIVLIVLLLMGCAVAPTIPTKRDSVVTGDTLIDRTYGYQISKPGKNWKFLCYDAGLGGGTEHLPIIA